MYGNLWNKEKKNLNKCEREREERELVNKVIQKVQNTKFIRGN